MEEEMEGGGGGTPRLSSNTWAHPAFESGGGGSSVGAGRGRGTSATEEARRAMEGAARGSPPPPSEVDDKAEKRPTGGVRGGGWREERRKVGTGRTPSPRPHQGSPNHLQAQVHLSRQEERVAAVRRDEKDWSRAQAQEWAMHSPRGGEGSEVGSEGAPYGSPPPTRQKYAEQALLVERARAAAMAEERRRAQAWAESGSQSGGEGEATSPRPEWGATRAGQKYEEHALLVEKARSEEMAAERNKARAWATSPAPRRGAEHGEEWAEEGAREGIHASSEMASPSRPEWSPQWGVFPSAAGDTGRALSPAQMRQERREKERLLEVRAEEMAAERRRARAWAAKSPASREGGPESPSQAPASHMPPWKGAGIAVHHEREKRSGSATDEARRAMEELEGAGKEKPAEEEKRVAPPRVVWDIHGRRRVLTEQEEERESAALESKLEVELFGRKISGTDSYLSTATREDSGVVPRKHPPTDGPPERRLGGKGEKWVEREAQEVSDQVSETLREATRGGVWKGGGEGTYERQMAWRQKVDGKVSKEVEEVRQAERQACTFAPTILGMSRALAEERLLNGMSGGQVTSKRDPMKLMQNIPITEKEDKVARDVMGEQDPFAMSMGIKDHKSPKGASPPPSPIRPAFPDEVEAPQSEQLSSDVAERLIQIGKRENAQMQVKRLNMEKQVLLERMAECTFQPNLDKTKNSRATARAEKHKELRERRDAQRREELLREAEAAEKEAFPFKPKVNPSSEKMVQRKFGNVDVVERLTNKGLTGSVMKEAKDLLGTVDRQAQYESDEKRRELLAMAVRRQKLGVSTDGEAAFDDFIRRSERYEANRKEKLEVSSEIQFLEDHPFHPLLAGQNKTGSRLQKGAKGSFGAVKSKPAHGKPRPSSGGEGSVTRTMTFEERQALALVRKDRARRRLEAEATPSFKPSISKRSLQMARGRDLDSMVNEMAESHHRREMLARMRAEEEMAACTFTPAIGPAPPGMNQARGRLRMDSSDPDQLDREHREKKKAKEDEIRRAREAENDANCTFQPQKAKRPPRYITQMAAMRKLGRGEVGNAGGFLGELSENQAGYASLNSTPYTPHSYSRDRHE